MTNRRKVKAFKKMQKVNTYRDGYMRRLVDNTAFKECLCKIFMKH